MLPKVRKFEHTDVDAVAQMLQNVPDGISFNIVTEYLPVIKQTIITAIVHIY